VKKRELMTLAFKKITAFRGTIDGVGYDSIDFEFNEPFNALMTLGLEKWAGREKEATLGKFYKSRYLNKKENKV
jgi:hypothetical protein